MKQYGVVNIGAAGTLVVRKAVSEKRLRIELAQHLPFKTEVMICTGQDLLDAASRCLFVRKPSAADTVQFVSVLAMPPKASLAVPTSIPESGKWLLKVQEVHGRFVFGVYRREMKAIGCLGKLDKLFESPATTRNWNTIRAILKVLENPL